tara:strand:- start:1733 stop:2152 length:420 start_codon:yes stop_codon:yes gene_type:complete
MKYIHEILEEVCKLDDRDDRINCLKENSSLELNTLLQLCYKESLVLDLPKGRPPFTEAANGIPRVPWPKVVKDVVMCRKGDQTTRVKKEKKFIEVLESIHGEDAAILCAFKDGTITNLQNKKYRKITKSLVEAAFPSLL